MPFAKQQHANRQRRCVTAESYMQSIAIASIRHSRSHCTTRVSLHCTCALYISSTGQYDPTWMPHPSASPPAPAGASAAPLPATACVPCAVLPFPCLPFPGPACPLPDSAPAPALAALPLLKPSSLTITTLAVKVATCGQVTTMCSFWILCASMSLLRLASKAKHGRCVVRLGG